MDSTERLQGYVKSDVRTVIEEKRSLMPAYGVDQLNEARSRRPGPLPGHAARSDDRPAVSESVHE